MTSINFSTRALCVLERPPCVLVLETSLQYWSKSAIHCHVPGDRIASLEKFMAVLFVGNGGNPSGKRAMDVALMKVVSQPDNFGTGYSPPILKYLLAQSKMARMYAVRVEASPPKIHKQHT